MFRHAAFSMIGSLVVAGGVAAAEASWQSSLTPFTPASHPPLAPCKLDYRVSWKGILDSGAIHLEFGSPHVKKPGSFVATFSGSSQGAAAALYDFKGWYWSEMHAGSLRPKLFHTIEEIHDRRVTYQLDYETKGVEWSRKTRHLSKGHEYENKGTFAFTPVHDLFSAMLFVRGRKLANGDDIAFVIQPGDDPYLVNIHVGGRELHEGRAAIRMAVTMRKIDSASLNLLPYAKLKQATLWLSDDADRIPLEIRAAVFIGDVRVILVNHAKF